MMNEKRQNIGLENETILNNHFGVQNFMNELMHVNNSDELADIEKQAHVEHEQVMLQFFLQVTYIAVFTLGLIGLVLLSQNAFAEERDFASQRPKQVSYKIQDGYGEYNGRGATKIAAQSEARTYCVMSKVNAYERKNGVTPDEDTVDLYFDACINR